MRQRWEVVPGSKQAAPGGAGEKRGGELLEHVFCQAQAAPPVAAPVLDVRGCPGTRPRRVLQPSAARLPLTQPPLPGRGLCHPTENNILPEAISVYK